MHYAQFLAHASSRFPTDPRIQVVPRLTGGEPSEAQLRTPGGLGQQQRAYPRVLANQSLFSTKTFSNTKQRFCPLQKNSYSPRVCPNRAMVVSREIRPVRHKLVWPHGNQTKFLLTKLRFIVVSPVAKTTKERTLEGQKIDLRFRQGRNMEPDSILTRSPFSCFTTPLQATWLPVITVS